MNGYGPEAATELEAARSLLSDPEAAAGTGQDYGAIAAAGAHALAGIGFALLEANRLLEEIDASLRLQAERARR